MNECPIHGRTWCTCAVPREPTFAEIRARADDLYARLGPASHPDGGLNAVITMMGDRLSGPNLPVEGPAIQYWLNLLKAHKAGRAPLSPELREALRVACDALYQVTDPTACMANDRAVCDNAAATLRSFLSVSTEGLK